LLIVAPSSQELEPPTIPARFTYLNYLKGGEALEVGLIGPEGMVRPGDTGT
jgi:hypothetical protein